MSDGLPATSHEQEGRYSEVQWIAMRLFVRNVLAGARPVAGRGLIPPLSLNPRFVRRQRTHFLSPRRNGGGTRGARDEQGGSCEFAAGRSYPRVTARSYPLWPAGHLPHFVGESVRERGSCLHSDREERRWRESLSFQRTQPLCSTTSRRSRLRGRKRPVHALAQYSPAITRYGSAASGPRLVAGGWQL